MIPEVVPDVFCSTPRSRDLLASHEGLEFKAAIEDAKIRATYSAFSPLNQDLRVLAAVFHRSCFDGHPSGQLLYAKHFPAQSEWVVGLCKAPFSHGGGKTLQQAIGRFREHDLLISNVNNYGETR